MGGETALSRLSAHVLPEEEAIRGLLGDPHAGAEFDKLLSLVMGIDAHGCGDRVPWWTADVEALRRSVRYATAVVTRNPRTVLLLDDLWGVAQLFLKHLLVKMSNDVRPDHGARRGAVEPLLVKSGTQALTLGLTHVKAGDAQGQPVVLTTPWTFIATQSAITGSGAMPIFVDIDPHTWTLDPEALRRTLSRLKGRGRATAVAVVAVVPVDMFGTPCDHRAIAEVCREHGVPVVLDGCQSFGAEYAGMPVCMYPSITATAVSFYPSKPLGGWGEGGALMVQDDRGAEGYREGLLRAVAVAADHGNIGGDDCGGPGTNGRPDAFTTAMLVSELLWKTGEGGELRRRRAVADVYREMLDGLVTFQAVPEGAVSALHGLQVVGKSTVLEAIARYIQVSTLYTCTLADSVYFAALAKSAYALGVDYGGADRLRAAPMLAHMSVTLPVYPNMDLEALRTALGKAVHDARHP